MTELKTTTQPESQQPSEGMAVAVKRTPLATKHRVLLTVFALLAVLGIVPPLSSAVSLVLSPEAAMSGEQGGMESVFQVSAHSGIIEPRDDYAAQRVITATQQDVADAQLYALQRLASYHWDGDEFQCLVKLWTKESNWRYTAENKSSGAYGIPQALPGSKMASVADDWRTNYRTQVDWGLNYIKNRYTTPCGAWNHSVEKNWY